MKYAKFWIAVLVTLATSAVAALTGDNTVTTGEWLVVAMAGGNAVLVAVVPNYPPGHGFATVTKAVVTGAMAVLAFLVSAIDGGLTTAEIIQCLVVLAGAYGVFQVPNTGNPALSPVEG